MRKTVLAAALMMATSVNAAEITLNNVNVYGLGDFGDGTWKLIGDTFYTSSPAWTNPCQVQTEFAVSAQSAMAILGSHGELGSGFKPLKGSLVVDDSLGCYTNSGNGAEYTRARVELVY